MKFLAVFGLALAVVAMDNSTSGDPQSLLVHFKARPRDPGCCSEVFFMVHEDRISLKDNPDVVFPLIRYCLEVDAFPTPNDYLEMSVVHVAAFIFMFRVKGEEGAAKELYDAVMEEHFPVHFEKKLHEKPYALDALLNFENLTDDDKKFCMLRTVKKYGKESESEVSRQLHWLESAELAALVLVNMGIKLEPLIVGIALLRKSLPVRDTHDTLSNLQLMFFSLTRDWYLRLEEPEKAQLLAFLEKYLRFRWNDHKLLTKKLSGEELEQFKVFNAESRFTLGYLETKTIAKFAGYFCNVMQVGCPAFLLKRMHDFYLEKPPFKEVAILDRKHNFLQALIEAREMVKAGECPSKVLVCSQIRCAILECDGDTTKFLKAYPEAMGKWERSSIVFGRWATFKSNSKVACADLNLVN